MKALTQELATLKSKLHMASMARLLVSAVFVVSTSAYADSLPYTVTAAREKNVLSQPFVNDGPVHSTQSTGSTRLDFAAGTQGKEASISYGDFSKRPWRVVLTSPLDSDSGSANFADLDGLTNATRITGEARLYEVARVPKDYALAVRINPVCAKLAAAIPDSASDTLKGIRAQAMPNKDGFLTCNTSYFDNAVEAAGKGSDDRLTKSLTALREEVYQAAARGVWFGITSFKSVVGDRTSTSSTSQRQPRKRNTSRSGRQRRLSRSINAIWCSGRLAPVTRTRIRHKRSPARSVLW